MQPQPDMPSLKRARPLGASFGAYVPEFPLNSAMALCQGRFSRKGLYFDDRGQKRRP